MVHKTQPDVVDAVLVHVGTNHLKDIVDNYWKLDGILEDHRRLVLEIKAVYPGLPVVVSAILPRYDWFVYCKIQQIWITFIIMEMFLTSL